MAIRYKGVIFDIDGTLTYTNRLIFDSFNHIAVKYLGRKFSDEEIVKLFGPTEDVILEQLCGRDYESARHDYYNYYRENHNIAQLYDGIRDLICDLKKSDVILSVFTGKGRTSSLITLNELGITEFFDLIVTGDDVLNHKPSPEGIQKFLIEFNLKPSEVLMIGDAPSDIIAARKSGVEIASALWDSYSEIRVKELNAGNSFCSVDDLRVYIFGSSTHH